MKRAKTMESSIDDHHSSSSSRSSVASDAGASKPAGHHAGTKTWAILLVVLMTGLTSSAQVAYKFAAARLQDPTVWSVITNHFLWIGLGLYGVGFILLNIAFHGGEVSTLYPIIATSYIWVAFLSYYLFGEHLRAVKVIGILMIVLGVGLISGFSKDGAVSEEVPV